MNSEAYEFFHALSDYYIADHMSRSPYMPSDLKWEYVAIRQCAAEQTSIISPAFDFRYRGKPRVAYKGETIASEDWAWLHITQAAQHKALQFKRRLP